MWRRTPAWSWSVPPPGSTTRSTHLIELGHRRIAAIGGLSVNSFSSPVPARREAGWVEALEAAGIERDPTLLRQGGDEVADPPTAIFCMWSATVKRAR